MGDSENCPSKMSSMGPQIETGFNRKESQTLDFFQGKEGLRMWDFLAQKLNNRECASVQILILI